MTKRFTDIQSEPMKWLWEGRIALGKLTMIAGDPGLGKSLLTATLAANVSKGYPFPIDGSCPPVGDVVLVSAEDDPSDTIKPRLEAAKADCGRIHVLHAIQDTDKDGVETERNFSFKRDIQAIKDLLGTIPECKLLVIDPVSAYLDGTDGNSNSDIRGLFAPLSNLASQHKIAVVLVSHLNKGSGGNALYRTMGSLAFTAAVRAAYIVTKDQNNPERRLFMPAKNNLAKDSTGLAYSVITAENGAPIIAWESEPVTMTADEALAIPESSDERTATDDAVDFLTNLLSGGSAKVSDIQNEARNAGISEKTLRRARQKLGVRPQKNGFNGGWVLNLPEDALIGEVALPNGEGVLEGTGHLREVKVENLSDKGEFGVF